VVCVVYGCEWGVYGVWCMCVSVCVSGVCEGMECVCEVYMCQCAVLQELTNDSKIHDA